MQRIHNRMLRAQIEKLDGRDFKADEHTAFNLLREGLLTDLYERKSSPRLNVYSDQIVWGRSPVHRYGGRMDGHSALLLVCRWECGEYCH